MAVTNSSGDLTFTNTAGNQAIAELPLTISAGDASRAHTFSFTVGRRPLYFRAGTSSGDQSIVADTVFPVGTHWITFTPGSTSIYLQFYLDDAGTATLTSFNIEDNQTVALPTPYNTADDLRALRFAQSLNTMYFANGNDEMQVFERRGVNSWSFRPFQPNDGPFQGLSDDTAAITMTPAAKTGTTTITASTAYFAQGMDGSLLRLTHSGSYVTDTLSAPEDVTAAIQISGVESDRNFRFNITGTWTGSITLQRSVGNEFTFTDYATYTTNGTRYLSDGLDNQIIYYRLKATSLSSGSAVGELIYGAGYTDGVARIVSVDADNTVTVDVLQPFSTTDETNNWSLGSWSSYYGHPSAVALFDGRLWVARASNYYGSASDNFSSFEIGVLDNPAISRRFGGRMNEVRWLASGSHLLAGLSGGEYEIRSNGRDDVITPANVKSRIQSTKGSANIQPIVQDSSVAFVSRSKERVYLFGYSSDTGDLQTDDLTRFSRTIAGDDGFREIAWQEEREPRLWAVLEDGTIACLLFNMRESIVAWSKIDIGGRVRSIGVLPDTPADRVYVLVEREVNGSTNYYVERFAVDEYTTLQDSWHLASALSTTLGSETNTFSNLDHLEGEEVYAWLNGQASGPHTVTSGSITTSFSGTKAIVGLLMEGRYRSGRLGGPEAMGRKVKVSSFDMLFKDTAAGAVSWGSSYESADLNQLEDRVQMSFTDASLSFDSQLQVYGANDEPYFYEGFVNSGYEVDQRFYLKMSTPGPATVLSVVPNITFNQK